MAEFTPNYNLKKPAEEDFYNINDHNDNMDIIDTALKAHDDALATKETPQGAQEKADAALNSAKQYTDQEVGEVAQELAAHKADGMHQKVEVTSTDDATSVTNAPLKSSGGLAVSKKSYFGDTHIFQNGGMIRKIGVERFTEIILTDADLGRLQSGQRLRISFRCAASQSHAVKLTLCGGRSWSSFDATGVIDKFIILHTDSDGNLVSTISDTRFMYNFTEEDIVVTGDDDSNINIIINNPTETKGEFLDWWTLKIEAFGVRSGTPIGMRFIEAVIEEIS